jgi:hypothetical protein
MDKNNKIIGNLSKNSHKEFNLIKINHSFKSAEETLSFLLNCYKSLNSEQIKNILYSNFKSLNKEKNI